MKEINKNIKSFLIYFIAALICQIIMAHFEQLLKNASGGIGKLGLSFNASEINIKNALFDYGVEGRKYFTILNIIDFFFPTLIAMACYKSFLLGFANYNNTVKKFLLALFTISSLLFVVFDFMEKIIFINLTSTYPNLNNFILGLAPNITNIKLSFLIISYTGFIIALISYILNIIKTKSKYG